MGEGADVLTPTIDGVEILDRTPLLDIQPCVPEFDAFPQRRAGWLENCGNRRTLADGRFPLGGSR